MNFGLSSPTRVKFIHILNHHLHHFLLLEADATGEQIDHQPLPEIKALGGEGKLIEEGDTYYLKINSSAYHLASSIDFSSGLLSRRTQRLEINPLASSQTQRCE